MKLASVNLSNIGRFCGLSTAAELGYSSSTLTDKLIEQETKGAVMLADYLSYRYFDSVSGLFFNEDGIVGFMLEIAPIVGSNNDLEKNLTLFVNRELPENVYLQFLLVAGHNIEDKLALWDYGRHNSGNVMLEQLTEYRRQFLQEKAKDFGNNDGRMGRDFRIYVSYSSKAVGNKAVEHAQSFQHKLIKKLAAIKLAPRLCNAEDLMWVAGDLAQMQMAERRRPSYNPLNSLAKQVIKPLEEMVIEETAIIHQSRGLVTKCFYPAKLPEEYSLIEMIELLGTGESGGGIPARFVISYTLASDISKAGSSQILARGNRTIHAAEQWYTRNDSNLKRQAIEWREIIAAAKNGERFLSENMQIMITTTKEEMVTAEENLKSLYNANDWLLEINQKLQLPAMLAILPMQQASFWQILNYFQLIKIVQSREVVAKLPIHGEWKGVPDSGVLLLGRRGELFNWNPFYRVGGGGNFNICVMAPAGSGKSVFLQELATSLLAQGTAVFILDIGASYQNICELIGGETIRFNSSNDISLNPFATIASSGAVYIRAMSLLAHGSSALEVAKITGLAIDAIEALEAGKLNSPETVQDEKIEILQIGEYFVTKDSIIYAKSIIAAMCGVKGDAHREAIIEKAISEGIEQYGTSLDVTKLVLVLSNIKDNEIAHELAETLYPYTEKGIHGRFFKAGKVASFQEMLTLFEFEEVKNDEVLLAVVLQVILMQVTMQFLCGDRSRRFALIVDEAWMILSFCGSFLEAFARTVRKYGGSLVTCVQDLASFQMGKSQKAIFENSTWKAVLKQTNLESFRNADEFKDHLPLIESVTKESSGKYSEILIQSSGMIIVGRLVLDPYSIALYSTEAADFNFLAKAKSAGIPKDQAVKELAKKYGQLPAKVTDKLAMSRANYRQQVS